MNEEEKRLTWREAWLPRFPIKYVVDSGNRKALNSVPTVGNTMVRLAKHCLVWLRQTLWEPEP